MWFFGSFLKICWKLFPIFSEFLLKKEENSKFFLNFPKELFQFPEISRISHHFLLCVFFLVDSNICYPQTIFNIPFFSSAIILVFLSLKSSTICLDQMPLNEIIKMCFLYDFFAGFFYLFRFGIERKNVSKFLFIFLEDDWGRTFFRCFLSVK